MISLRQATATDIPALQALFVLCIRQTCTTDYTEAEIAVWTATAQNSDRWNKAVADQYFLIAEEGKKLAGFGSLRDGNYLDFMYVHPDFQGRGVAGKLLAALEAKALRLGTASLHSDISITARPFFEKKGYGVLHENRNERSGEVLVNYRMERVL